MAINPLHQFEVAPLLSHPLMVGGFDLTPTNQALWTGIAVAFIIAVMCMGVAQMKMVPGRLQALVEMTVEFGRKLTVDTAGKEALPFFPIVLTLFLFVAALNLIGMVPHAFTATSQITTTAYMGCMVFVMVVGIGVYTQGLHFFGMFLPHGTPMWLAPLIVPLEVIMFLVRPFTLAVRLAANMVAGHVMLKIFAGFCIMLLGVEGVQVLSLHGTTPVALLPLVMLVILSGLEAFVALLQAYIFTILACVYLNEALHGH